MKVNWEKKYNTMAVYSLLVICCSIIFYLIISKSSVFIGKFRDIISIFQPFIVGAIIAYLLNFILKFYEKKVLGDIFQININKKAKRGLSILLTYITFILFIFLFVKFVLPQLFESLLGLANSIPTYVNNLSSFLQGNIDSTNIIQSEILSTITTKVNMAIEYIIKVAADMIPILGNLLVSITSSIWNIILGLIISIYILIDKERFYALSKKICYGIFSKNKANIIIKITDKVNYTFGRFIVGKIIDSFIIGVLTFLVLVIFKMPYAPLISVIIGITNIIPFFGPFIGAVPSTIIIFFVSPIKALWFLIIILIIQQIDGNIIGPKILGDSIGISPFWVLFSILIMGKLMGILGMVIGVPLFAVIYSIIKEIIEERLKEKGLPIATEEYSK